MTHTPNRNYEQGYREARHYLRCCSYISDSTLRVRRTQLFQQGDEAAAKGLQGRADYLYGKAAAYHRKYRTGAI